MIRHALPEDEYNCYMSVGEIAVALGVEASTLLRRLKKWRNSADVVLRGYYKPSSRGWRFPLVCYHIEDVIQAGCHDGYLWPNPYFFSIIETRRKMPKNPRVDKPISPVWQDPFKEKLR